MKKRYIFGIVMTALLAVAVIAFFVYKNLDDIKDAFSTKKKSANANVVKAVMTTTKVTPMNPDVVVNATRPDSKLTTELDVLKSKTQELTEKANQTFDKVIDTLKAEGETKAAQSTHVSAIVVENSKQR
jgi:hypothetical protein